MAEIHATGLDSSTGRRRSPSQPMKTGLDFQPQYVLAACTAVLEILNPASNQLGISGHGGRLNGFPREQPPLQNGREARALKPLERRR
jgi:hypothetical protein